MTTKAAPKEAYPNLTKPERKHIAVLEERQTYLWKRISAEDCSKEARSYLVAERDALAWALSEIDASYEADHEQAGKVLALLPVAMKDGERAHAEADKLLLQNVSRPVREAYEALVEAAPFWVTS